MGGLGHGDLAVAVEVRRFERGCGGFRVLSGRFLAGVVDAVAVNVDWNGALVSDDATRSHGAPLNASTSTRAALPANEPERSRFTIDPLLLPPECADVRA